MTDRIFGELAGTWHELTRHHQPHHQPYPENTTPKGTTMQLITTIENDLATAGHTIDQAAHDILTRHLGLANIAAHIARETAIIAANPLTQAAERAAGLPAPAIAAIATLIDQLTTGLVNPSPASPQQAAA